MTRIPIMLCTGLFLGLAALPEPGRAFTPELPATARAVVTRTEPLASYPLPTGAFTQGRMQTRLVEGPMAQTAWQFDLTDETTLQLLAPLRAQLVRAGYSVIFECEAATCGGFDFRYETPVLPEPEMHVDLGDYRFLSAENGAEAVSLLVSRSSATGFVQMVQVGPGVGTASVEIPDNDPDAAQLAGTAAETRHDPIDMTGAPPDLGTQLSAGEAVVLDDLIFASGASALSDGSYPSLAALADWLKAHPAVRVALVGHTDVSGALEGNIALSRQRAQSVRQRMVARYAIAPEQVTAEGIGYLSPRASNLSEAGRERNRRVEVVVTSDPATP